MVEVPIERLEPNPWNSNHVSPENEKKLDASLKRFGLFKPVLVRELPNSRLQIIGGEHRWSAAKRLGYTTVPIINLGRITDHRAKEIGLADNGRYGEDDTLQLGALLKELGADNIADFLPYTSTDLENIFTATSIALDDLDLDGDKKLPDLNTPPPAPTHQLMRFKVPIADVAWVQALVEREMKAGGFTKEDSLSNAGNALVNLLNKAKENL